MQKTTYSEENYLETIYNLLKNRDDIHASLIAETLDFSRASVSKALSTLESKNFIKKDSEQHITLTKTGEKTAEEIIKKHSLLKNFLIQIGVSESIAEKDACEIEHIISEETIRKISDLNSAFNPMNPAQNSAGFNPQNSASSDPNSFSERVPQNPANFDPNFLAYYYEDDNFFGIKNYDKVTFDELFEIDFQKKILIENTEKFISGKKASNMLLFGDGGCGKSSSIKALLSLFENRKLKLISLEKKQIDILPKILRKLTDIPYYFFLFFDDLSFEDTEEEYKTLKSIIEGRIERKPLNTIFVVTTNRRHLIKESWKDRDVDDEMHLSDTIAEKHSLSERFGVNISFLKPNKDEYLEIVKGLANENNIEVTEDLIKEALTFERRHSGRSGRVAKMFIDSI